MVQAQSDTPEIFRCVCGGFRFEGGITHGQRMDETTLSCSECHRETVVSDDEIPE